MLAAPVQDHAEVARDPQVLANAYIQAVERPGGEAVPMVSIGVTIDNEPVPIPHLSPQLGEHTEEVLLEHGYSWEEIADLRTAGVIGPKGDASPN
jgi:crotonobetainyl-CoA:carnitine CoA-transferase CaiB-like acyl-CoA transferase